MLLVQKGVRSRGMTPEVTQETGRRRTTSEGQYQSSHDNTPMVDSPNFTHKLSLNPGGRPREGHMHSYREAFEDDEADGFDNCPAFGGGGENSPPTPSFPVSPQTPYFNMSRSPPGLIKTPLSALGLKPHHPGGSDNRSFGDCRTQPFSVPFSSSSPVHSADGKLLIAWQAERGRLVWPQDGATPSGLDPSPSASHRLAHRQPACSSGSVDRRCH